jgi:hypothetical protein
MTLSRLLVPVLLVCSASAFAQQQNVPLTSTPSEPWRITSGEADTSAVKNPFDRMHIDQFKVDPKAAPFTLESRLDPIVVTPEGLAGDDTLCYTIRSYVVARDSKDSDSVHPVGYSTCQPASRYRLKSAEMRVSGR